MWAFGTDENKALGIKVVTPVGVSRRPVFFYSGFPLQPCGNDKSRV